VENDGVRRKMNLKEGIVSKEKDEDIAIARLTEM
jgi:hypothetical protein